MSDLRPIRLDPHHSLPIIPYAGHAHSRNKILQQWLDSNFSLVGHAVTGRLAPRGILTRQPVYFSYHNPNIIPVVINPEGIDWPTSGFRAVTTVPNTTFTPIMGRWVDTETFTQLPKIVTEVIDDVVDFTSSKLFKYWTIADTMSALKDRRGSSKRDMQIIADHNFYVDTIGTVSFFGNDEKLKAVGEQLLPKKMKGIRVDKLYRGKSDVGFEIEEVTKAQVLDGRAFFLYKSETDIISQTDTAIVTKNCINLGCYIEYESIARFKKARKFLIDFLKTLDTTPERIFAPEEYKKLLNDQISQFTTFWEGIADMVDLGALSKVPEVYDMVEQTVQKGDFVTNEAVVALSAKNQVDLQPEGKKLRLLEKALDSLKAQRDTIRDLLQKTKNKKVHVTNTITQNESDIEIFEKKIVNLTKITADLEQVLPTITEQIEEKTQEQLEISTATADMVDKVNKANIEYKKAVKAILSDGSKPNYIKNMLKSGIVITNIRFRNINSNTEVNLSEMPEVAVNDEWEISKITLMTTRPTRIYIDRHRKGDKAKVIAGGPYEIRLSILANGSPKMAIRLASHNSVFGRIPYGNDWWCKPHPHTDKTNVQGTLQSIDMFVKEWKNCCLGEVEGIIINGFTERNPKMIIAAVLTWLSSCFSDDEWGKHWDWFPPASKVDFDARNYEMPEVPDIDESVKNMNTKMESIVIQTTQQG